MSEVLTGLSANPQPLTIKAQSGICQQTRNWEKASVGQNGSTLQEWLKAVI